MKLTSRTGAVDAQTRKPLEPVQSKSVQNIIQTHNNISGALSEKLVAGCMRSYFGRSTGGHFWWDEHCTFPFTLGFPEDLRVYVQVF